ncbi:MAG: exosortase-associated EpsI family protein [Lentisphaerae bacterium]|nr:exosortase-associated EpsI family protein [Lentisphaerota bacterium]
MKKLVLLLASAVPLGVNCAYLLEAWRSSRLDQFDWIFYLLTVPAVAVALRKEKLGKCDFTALFLLLPMLAGALTTAYHQINALGVATAVLTIYAAFWLLFSWQSAALLLPAAVIMLLGTPSSSYAVSLVLMVPVYAAWGIKFLLAAGCLLWIWGNWKFAWRIKKSTVVFTAAVLGSSCLLLHTGEIYFEGKSLVPEFAAHVGEFWGRDIQVDENTRRFFVTSQVRQYRYTKVNIDISVLAVQCGSDIHEIHPASHCLRTSRWTVNSENIYYLQDNFAVTEIDAQKGRNRYLVWVWYSSEKFSTPGFLGFRRHFRPGGKYYTYQIAIPVYSELEKSRNELQNFVRALKGKAEL